MMSFIRVSQQGSSAGTIRSGSVTMNGSLEVAAMPRLSERRNSLTGRRISWWKRSRFALSQLRTSGPEALSTIVSR